MNKKEKKGFTIAEVLITLVLIATISILLLSVGLKNAPDQDMLMLKKNVSVFSKTLREIMETKQYFPAGNLSYEPCTPDPEATNPTCPEGYRAVTSPTYLCRALKDIISEKEYNCSNGGSYIVSIAPGTAENTIRTSIDAPCGNNYIKNSTSYTSSITTADGSVWFEPAGNQEEYENYFFGQHGGHPNFCQEDDVEFNTYKVYCIDVDGEDIAEPFGLAIRCDGRIVYGQKIINTLGETLLSE